MIFSLIAMICVVIIYNIFDLVFDEETYDVGASVIGGLAVACAVVMIFLILFPQ